MSDLISRQDAINEVEMAFKCVSFDKAERFIVENLNALPSAQPETDEEIQTMQDLEQAQFDEVYELCWNEGIGDDEIAETDLIRRSDALDFKVNITGVRRGKNIASILVDTYKEYIKSLPSAQPFTDEEIHKMQDLEFAEIEKAYETGLREGRKKGEWIPVSERLPEKDGMYYVTVRDSKGDIDAVPCLWFFDKWGINGFEVIAWIKIPEPYKGEYE